MAKLKSCLALVLAIACFALRSEEISAEQAIEAVTAWGELSGTISRPVAAAETLTDDESEAKMHIVSLKGGGFVVTSADDRIDPIILYSDCGKFDFGDKNPLKDILCRDLAVRKRVVDASGSRMRFATAGATAAGATLPSARWAKLLNKSATTSRLKLAASTNTQKTTMASVLIEPLLSTEWGQGDDAEGRPCYNLYTPANGAIRSLSGCVATAGAQLMKFYGYPTAAVAKKTYTCTAFGKSVSLAISGGPYAWDNMPNCPGVYSNEDQRDAVGRFIADVAIACGASFGSDATGASVLTLSNRLVDLFGYAQSVFINYSATNLEKIVVPNLIASQPLVMSMNGSGGGHAVVVDGLSRDNTYDASKGDLYLHINMGWEGSYSAWYRPPQASDALQAGGYEFSVLDGFVSNVRVSGTGSMVAGRVTMQGTEIPVCGESVKLIGKSSSGKSITLTTSSNQDGYYSFVVDPGTYTVAGKSVTVGACSRTNCGNVVCDLASSATRAPTPTVNTTKFSNDKTISVSSSISGAEIRYTMDGSVPRMSSLLYEGEFKPWKAGTYKFVVFAAGRAVSEVRTLVVDSASVASPDNFADALVIEGDSGAVMLNNENATSEKGEPTIGYYQGVHSLWITFTPKQDHDYTFTLTGPSSASRYFGIAVFEGTSISALKTIDRDYGYKHRSVSVHAKAGVRYYVGLDTKDDAEKGDLEFSWKSEYHDKLTFDKTSFLISSLGETLTTGIKSTAEWTVTSKPSWATLAATSGKANESMTVTVAKNTTGSSRTATIGVRCGNTTTAIPLYQASHPWVKTKAEALSASNGKKPILLLYGESWCGITTSMFITRFETSPLKETLAQNYVLWLSDSGDAHEYVWDWVAPQYAVIDPMNPDVPRNPNDKEYEAYFSGGKTLAKLQDMLQEVEKIPNIEVTTTTSGAKLKWTAVPGATSYTVYRFRGCDSSQSYYWDLTGGPIASGITGTEYSNANLTNDGKFYGFAVAANIGGTLHTRSRVARVRLQLPKPMGVSAYASGARVAVSFNQVNNGGYYWLMRQYAGEREPTIVSWLAHSGSYTTRTLYDDGYQKGKSASYWIVASKDRKSLGKNADGSKYLYAPYEDGSQSTSAKVTYYIPIYYTLKYWNGTASSTVSSLEIGKALTLKTGLFTKTGYTFAGWAKTSGGAVAYKDGASVKFSGLKEGDTVELYAVWRVNSYTVAFNANGGSGVMSAQSIAYEQTAALPSNAFTREGYDFLGWSTNSSATSAAYVDGASVKNLSAQNGTVITLYAVWKKQPTYVIRFNRYDGTDTQMNVVFRYGVSTKLPTLAQLKWARGGQEFLGWATSAANASAGTVWKTDGANVATPTDPDKTLNVYAVWNLKSGYYQLKFHKNDGSGAWRTAAYEWGKNTTLPSCGAGLGWWRPGYSFKGWSFTADGAKIWKPDRGNVATGIPIDTSKDIYAIWEALSAPASWDEVSVTAGSGKTAAEIMGNGHPLAKVDLYLLKRWCSGKYAVGTVFYNTANGKTLFSFDSSGNPETAASEAFLFNCAESELASHKRSFRIADFSVSPTGLPTVNAPEGNYNGTLIFQGSNNLSTWTDLGSSAKPGYRFFRLRLKL